MKKQEPDKIEQEDDGRVVASMNVEGMPWYVEKPDTLQSQGESQPRELSREEVRAYRNSALKAGLLVVSVYGICALLFILFCVYVWFA